MKTRRRKWPMIVAGSLLALGSWPVSSQVVARRASVSTTSPAASRVALDVLRRGGGAIDATVAGSMALMVTAPHLVSPGGGGFLLYYEKESGDVWSLDFIEASPLEASVYSGKPRDAIVSGLAFATPGMLAGLEEAHKRFGSIPWKDVVGSSARLAAEGSRVETSLASAIGSNRDRLQSAAVAKAFFRAGQPVAAGEILVQPQLSRALDQIGREGASSLYRGELARTVAKVARQNGGVVNARDLREYRAIWRAPLRLDVRGHEVYTMSAPSNGGVGLALILALAEPDQNGDITPESIHNLAEIETQALLECRKIANDPETDRVRFDELLSSGRINGIRASLNPERATLPPRLSEIDEASSGMVIVDASGNIAIASFSLHEAFGSGVFVDEGGFFLNSSMRRFDDAPELRNNKPAPKRRVPSSMLLSLTFREGSPRIAASVNAGIANARLGFDLLNGVLHDRSSPRIVQAARYFQGVSPAQIEYEKGAIPLEMLASLNHMGHAVHERDTIGAIYGVEFRDGEMIVLADSRFGGAAGGF